MNYAGHFEDNDGNKYFTGIVESGSNENGNYVKFSDGTMICYLITTVTDQAIDNQYGSLYQSTRRWYFPARFKDNNISVVCGLFQWGTSASWGTINEFPSSDSVSLRVIDIIQRSAGTECKIQAIAIGKWK